MAPNSKRPSGESMASLAVLVLVTFFTSLYMKGLNSGIPLHYDDLGYSATIGGTFVAVFTLASTAMRLAGGQITDRFSHFKVLVASLVGLLLGVAIPAVIDNFYVVMASRVLQGASFALATNVTTVAVMGSASKKHLGRRVGIDGAGTSLGTMLGALVATWLLGSVGYRGFYLAYALLMVAAIVAVVVLERKKEGARQEHPDTAGAQKAVAPAKAQDGKGAPSKSSAPLAQRLRTFIEPYLMPQLAPYMAISFARRLSRGFCVSFILIYAKVAHIPMGPAFFIVAGATTLACRLFGGKLFDSTKTWLLLPLLSVEIVGFGALSIAPSFATLMVAAVCYGIAIGTASPFLKTLTAKAAPQEHWGVVNGELYFFGDLGKALGAFGGGLLIDATAKVFVPEIALGFAVLTSVATAIALWLGHRRENAEQAQS